MNLRELARGRDCLVRLPGCTGGGETTVLAHYSLAGISGKGLKSPDLLGAWACFNCHDAIDGRRIIAGYNRDQLRLAHAEGCFRTQSLLMLENHIKIA